MQSGEWVPKFTSTNNKNCKRFFYLESKRVYFSGDFDSGNLEEVEQLGPYESQYKLRSGYDHPTILCSYKAFFHFRVAGFTECRVRFHISRVNLLNGLFKNGKCSHYRPVYRLEGETDYRRITEPVKITAGEEEDVDLAFQFMFGEDCPVYFAFAYPYPYHKIGRLLDEIEVSAQDNSDVYFHKEVLTHSTQHRKIYLLTLSSKANCLEEREEPIQGLFENHINSRRPFKLKKKPKVLITARVHPGETSASFCFQGLLHFLLDKQDYRAHLLRKSFHFLMVPVLNPDGVYHGMYRTDLNYCNLNRMYYHCTPSKQPTIWAVRKLVQSMGTVDFFFDLHGHASKKGFFVYGNAFDDIHLQTESELFAKLLELNSPYFEKFESNFSKKHMKAKEKADDYSKEGCARVFMYKTFNIVHSYTIECGFHTPNLLNTLPLPRDPTAVYGQYHYTEVFETERDQFYTPQSYMNLGKAMLVSLLDVFDRNPYTRVFNSEHKTLDNLRKALSNSLYQSCERFRIMDPNCLKKLRQANDLIKEYYVQRFNYTSDSEKVKQDQLSSPVKLPSAVKPLRVKKLSSGSLEPIARSHSQTSSVVVSRSKQHKVKPDLKVQELPTPPLNRTSQARRTVRESEYLPQALSPLEAEILRMKESGVWTFEMGKKTTDQSILNRRKLSLKNADSEKKLIKLKGIQEKNMEKKERSEKLSQSVKSLKNDNYNSTKERFYEQFLTRKMDNLRNFVSVSKDCLGLATSSLQPGANLPPLREASSRDITTSKMRKPE